MSLKKNLSTFEKFKDAFNCFRRPSFNGFCLAKNNSQTQLDQFNCPPSYLSSYGSDRHLRSRATEPAEFRELVSKASEQRVVFQPLEVTRFDYKIFQKTSSYGVCLIKQTNSGEYKRPNRRPKMVKKLFPKRTPREKKFIVKRSSSDQKEEESDSMDFYEPSPIEKKVILEQQQQAELESLFSGSRAPYSLPIRVSSAAPLRKTPSSASVLESPRQVTSIKQASGLTMSPNQIVKATRINDSKIFKVPKVYSFVSTDFILQNTLSTRQTAPLDDHKISLIQKMRQFMNKQRELEMKPSKSHSRCEFGPPDTISSLNQKVNYTLHQCDNCLEEDNY